MVKFPRSGALALSLFLLLSGCAKNIDTKEAVQDGVRKGVAKRGIDVDQMDVTVTSVSFHGNTADATVAFAAKGSPANTGVSVNYQLERIKDEWVVKSRAPMNAAGHTQGGPLPVMPGSSLPPGHPSVAEPK